MVGGLSGIEVVVQASSELLPEAAAGTAGTVADLILWDTGWAGSDRTLDEALELAVPILALVADDETARIVQRIGCRGILDRLPSEEHLVAAMTAVAAGLAVWSPSLVGPLQAGKESPDPIAADLTPREVEVLSLLAEGLTNKAIAQRLAISDHTVKFHVNAILTKLDAQSRTDAVVRATRLGLLAL